MFNKAVDICKTKKLQSQVQCEQTTIIIRQKIPQNAVDFCRSDIQASCSLDIDDNALQELKKAFKIQLQHPSFQINKQIWLGDQVPDFGAIKEIFQESSFLLNHKKGQVWLIDVWATWCGPCQEPMTHNQKMLEKNQESWSDRVKIFGVSVDEDFQQVRNRVDDKNWKKIKHLGLGKWDKSHPLITMFNINGIPFVCLVGKDGKINYKGHPQSINLQQRINELLEDKFENLKGKQKQQAQDEQTADNKSVANLRQILSKQIFDQLFKNFELFSVRVQMTQSLKKGKIQSKVDIDIKCNQNDKKAIQIFKSKIGNLNGFKIEQNLLKYMSIPNGIGKPCQDCKNIIKQGQYFYWCKFEENPNIFRCRNCCERPKDRGWPSYKKNVVLTNGNSGNISVRRFGKNLQPGKQQQWKTPQYACNGCQECPQSDLKIARYVCLECRPQPNHGRDYVDICYRCLKQYLEGSQQNFKQISDKLDAEGHTKNHAFIRILFDVKGYYEY